MNSYYAEYHTKHLNIFGKHFIFSNRSKQGIKELGKWGYSNQIGCLVILTPLFGVTIVK